MAIFEKINVQMKKKTQEGDNKNKLFLKNLERMIFSKHEEITRKWDLDKIVFVAKVIFVDNMFFNLKKRKRNFPRSSKN